MSKFNKPIIYDPANWYWHNSELDRIYSSKQVAYVDVNNQDYKDWIKKGNRATVIDNEESLIKVLNTQYPQGQPITVKLIRKRLTVAVQKFLDSKAAARSYGDEKRSATDSVISYENDKNPRFAADAAVFKSFRSDVWVTCYSLISEIERGLRSIPSEEELLNIINERCVLVWNEVDLGV